MTTRLVETLGVLIIGIALYQAHWACALALVGVWIIYISSEWMEEK